MGIPNIFLKTYLFLQLSSATVSLRISSAIAAAKRCLYVIGDKVTVSSSNVGSSSRVFVIMGFPDAMQVL